MFGRILTDVKPATYYLFYRTYVFVLKVSYC